eukprot:11856454-Alexandrium_andersonii.AAC.1
MPFAWQYLHGATQDAIQKAFAKAGASVITAQPATEQAAKRARQEGSQAHQAAPVTPVGVQADPALGSQG